MAKKFRQVANLATLPGDQLAGLFANMPDSQVIRTILMAEIEEIRAGAERETRTMRNMWYDVVKPILSRAGILNQTTSGGNPMRWDGLLSKYLAELIRAGVTTYEELQIIDGSRQRQVAVNITTTIANVSLVGAHFPWVILFTEKDTIWGEVETLASLYGVSAISGGGQPSNACTENTVREIVRSPTFRRCSPDSLIILSLTDYDPFGYSIAESQNTQVLEAARGLNPSDLGGLKRVNSVRLGLRPDQLTPEERQAKAYEPKDQGLEEWFKQTGGVDGQRLGLELDSLPLSRLRRMFAEGIEQHIDIERRRQDLREAFLDLLACELLTPDFEAKRAAMRAAVRTNGLWREIVNTPIPDDLFIRAAVAGLDCINPTEDIHLYDSYRESVKQVMNEAGSGE